MLNRQMSRSICSGRKKEETGVEKAEKKVRKRTTKGGNKQPGKNNLFLRLLMRHRRSK